MALLKCSECDKEFSTEAPSCPNCGRPRKFTIGSDGSLLPASTRDNGGMGTKTKVFLGISIVVIGFLFFGYQAGSTPEAKEKGSARFAIQFCWDEQKRKSLEPGQQRFIAQACEKMEADFSTKYGVPP